MRLIDTITHKLHEFTSSSIPPYAILSHTWGDDEVKFQDMSSPDFTLKKGYDKIAGACNLAKGEGLQYAWVDTCCIDKSNSAELAEAINSMFEWYKKAEVCYAFLSDVSEEVSFPDSRWFSRGWTLQELIAPRRLEFFNAAWESLGSKLTHADLVTTITNIPGSVIRGHRGLEEYSIAIKMSWAAYRQTTRLEDKAYCLLGIFSVHMPMIYGEGEMAFRRLQEEIIKRDNDLTIFGWDFDPNVDRSNGFQNTSISQDPNRLIRGTVAPLFAQSPASFVKGAEPYNDDFSEFSLSNKGLVITQQVLRLQTRNGRSMYGLTMGSVPSSSQDDGRDFVIALRKIGPGFYYRWAEHSTRTAREHLADFKSLDGSIEFPFHIVADPTIAHRVPFKEFRENAIHLPYFNDIRLMHVSPQHLWDVTDGIFLRPEAYQAVRYPMVLLVLYRTTVADEEVKFGVLCDYMSRDVEPVCKVFQDRGVLNDLVSPPPKIHSMSLSYQDIVQKYPQVARWGSDLNTVLTAGLRQIRISVRVERNQVKCEGLESPIPVHSVIPSITDVFMPTSTVTSTQKRPTWFKGGRH